MKLIARLAANVTVGLNSMVSSRKDASQNVAELIREHGLMKACIAQFQSFAEQHERGRSISPEVRDETHTAISETKTILQELHDKIQHFLPASKSVVKRTTTKMSWKYAWSERTLQAIMHRLRARRNALTVIMQLWSA